MNGDIKIKKCQNTFKKTFNNIIHEKLIANEIKNDILITFYIEKSFPLYQSTPISDSSLLYTVTKQILLYVLMKFYSLFSKIHQFPLSLYLETQNFFSPKHVPVYSNSIISVIHKSYD